MKVTTRTGDTGQTDLMFGHRVRKDDARIHAVGTLDELNSWMGLVKSRIKDKAERDLLHACQRDIFIISSEIVTLPRDLARLQLRTGRDSVRRLDKLVADYEKKVTLIGCCFLIPGESETSAMLDVARCVARRAERSLVALRGRKAPANAHALAFLNRLSDLLYLMARAHEKSHVRFVARPRKKAATSSAPSSPGL